MSMTSNTHNHDIIVAGASMGGVEALLELVSGLPSDFPASLFCVMHFLSGTRSSLNELLGKRTPRQVIVPQDMERIKKGVIYLARPDHHMAIQTGVIRMVNGPKVNRWRPAIDPLFESAAVAYTSRVIGIVLSGLLDDGTIGLAAIKKCGGITMVQALEDALVPDMPQSALKNVDIDYSLPAAEIGKKLNELSHKRAGPGSAAPENLKESVGSAINIMTMKKIKEHNKGKLAAVSCPECGGPIWEQKENGITSYECQVKHKFTLKSLLSSQDDNIEDSLWHATMVLEQRARMFSEMANDERRRGRLKTAEQDEENAKKAMSYAQTIRKLLAS